MEIKTKRFSLFKAFNLAVVYVLRKLEKSNSHCTEINDEKFSHLKEVFLKESHKLQLLGACYSSAIYFFLFIDHNLMSSAKNTNYIKLLIMTNFIYMYILDNY